MHATNFQLINFKNNLKQWFKFLKTNLMNFQHIGKAFLYLSKASKINYLLDKIKPLKNLKTLWLATLVRSSNEWWILVWYFGILK